MRAHITITLAAIALAAPASASAAFPHVVAPGESLSSVAAADGLSVDQLASANGIAADQQLLSGSTLLIPPQSGHHRDQHVGRQRGPGHGDVGRRRWRR